MTLIDMTTEFEARRWFNTFNRTSITAESLLQFRTWRQQPLNDEAYRRVEDRWRATTFDKPK